MTLTLAIAGSTGRMGQALLRLAAETPGVKLAHAGGLADTPQALFAGADAVIDFTAPDYTAAIAQACAGKIHIIGTTGLSPAQQETVQAAAQRARIVQSANFSLGVNVLEALVERASALLQDDYDIEIDEMHHALKKDAPSGTALTLARAAAKGRNVDLAKHKVHYGEGQLGERKRGTIGMSVRRGGEVVGDHTVTLAGPGERLELSHKAGNRDIYAHGAIRAALWAATRKPGLYSMRDVLGI